MPMFRKMLLPCLPIITRQKASGCINWSLDLRVLDKHQSTEFVHTALQLDPDMTTRLTTGRLNATPFVLWNGFCYLHNLCGASSARTTSGLLEPDTIQKLKLALQYARPGAVNIQHKHDLHSDTCECYKCLSSLMTPLHVAVLVAGGYGYFKGGNLYKKAEDKPLQWPVKFYDDSPADQSSTWIQEIVKGAEDLLQLAGVLVEAGADIHVANRWQETPVSLLADIVAAIETQPFDEESNQQLKAVFAKWQQLFKVGI